PALPRVSRLLAAQYRAALPVWPCCICAVEHACFLFALAVSSPSRASALQRASVSCRIKKSAKAETFEGRGRAVGGTKYNPHYGSRQSVRSCSSRFSGKHCVAISSGSLPLSLFLGASPP